MDKYIPAPQGATNKFISSHNDSPVICASCGRRVVRKGRTQRYCSARCRDRGRGRSRKAFLGRPYRSARDPHKSASNINALQRAKTRPSPYANAPMNILGGSFRWPGTPRLDVRTLENIRRCEVAALSAISTLRTGVTDERLEKQKRQDCPPKPDSQPIYVVIDRSSKVCCLSRNEPFRPKSNMRATEVKKTANCP
jgi:hypothetical protein